MADIGVNFGPTAGQDQQKPGPLNQLQDAIRILSFQVPKTVGANSPIPQGLLGGPSGMGGLNSALMQQWLRLIFGGGPQGPGGGGPMPGWQDPNNPFPTMPGPTGGPHIPLPGGPRTYPPVENPIPLPGEPRTNDPGPQLKGGGLPGPSVTPGGDEPGGRQALPWEDTGPGPSVLPPMRGPGGGFGGGRDRNY